MGTPFAGMAWEAANPASIDAWRTCDRWPVASDRLKRAGIRIRLPESENS